MTWEIVHRLAVERFLQQLTPTQQVVFYLKNIYQRLWVIKTVALIVLLSWLLGCLFIVLFGSGLVVALQEFVKMIQPSPRW